jgi:8-oxo-dGTP diphosphatase
VEGKARGIGPGDTDVRVVSATGDGDDMIVETVASVVAPDVECVVVTADRELRRRCVAKGAEVAGPRWLLNQIAPR